MRSALRTLLACGAKLEAQDDNFRTALWKAVERQSVVGAFDGVWIRDGAYILYVDHRFTLIQCFLRMSTPLTPHYAVRYSA